MEQTSKAAEGKEEVMSEAKVTSIPAGGSLDAITVLWQNFGPNQGQVTIVCWGSAWTSYFGWMGEESIEKFFARANTSYLVNKLGITQWLKSSKRHYGYLGRIIEAVKASMKAEATHEN